MSELRILIIDDNPDDRLLVLRELKRIFPELKYWEINENASLALALQANDFNFVVTDYQLCWTTGIDILHTIKQQQPECPVIMFTGTGSEEVAVRAMKAGLDDYIIKTSLHYAKLAAAVGSIWNKINQQQALSELKQRYDRLFERAPVGLYRLNPQGEILEANSTLVKMFGYKSREELLNCNLSKFYLNYQQERDWQKQLEEDVAIENFEVQARCQNGKTILLRHNAIAVKNLTGEIIYYEGAVEDITIYHQAERERAELLQRERQAREEAEIANSLKNKLFATLSRELRTPLNAVLGWVQLLSSGQLAGEQTQKAIKIIERNAKTQHQLIERSLDVARVIRGDLKLIWLPVPLSATISMAIDSVRLLAEAKQIELQPDLKQDSAEIDGDPQRLQQVFWNLLTNAIKFSPPGSKVSITLKKLSDRVRVSVSDSGKGISPDDLPYIFVRFGKTQFEFTETESESSLGFGLVVARYLVELHGGIIVARSEGMDRGATFIVELPLRGYEI
ncbi:ATP-binding protein [Myxosarcina sp. GI1]|uniref:hybrid sensor histidine kinase/response regulator n=1 Tax=Myxosarcina sp. GI1 TaxID=1541065 RepID=UPI00068C7FE0|nr:ATP-binding protein [Myxosarcina sp. GI1]